MSQLSAKSANIFIMESSQNKKIYKCIDSVIFTESSSLQSLVKKAQKIQQIGQKLQARLDPSLQGNFTLANINDGIATILANSSAWATRLRYHVPVILDELNEQLGQDRVKTVRIKITPTHQEVHTFKHKHPGLSPAAASFLIRTANDFGDGPIRDALLNIARHQTTDN